MTIERDVLDRLERLGIGYYVTGSWAAAMYAEPRMTRDIDVVLDAGVEDYQGRIRSAFEPEFLVNDPVGQGGRLTGGLIHKRELARVDFMFGRADAWARSAMGRRILAEHPSLGRVWLISAEDLVLIKLEWSEGVSELQLRDVRSLIRLNDNLDWSYLERYAAALGIRDRLEAVRDG